MNAMIASPSSFTTRFVLTAILMICSLSGFTQQQNLDTIVNRFKRYRIQTLQEKLYLHTDRSSYLAGETLWFKAYLTDGSLHKPLDVSKVVYVELLDKQNRPVLQTKISMEGGYGHGSLYLPPSLNSEAYTFRAYTNWMKNFSADFYFHKTIHILNTFTAPEASTSFSESQYDLQFFPEGGNLVAGLASKVAFRATDQMGKGSSFRGIIFNHKNDTILKFKPLRFGMGSFTFIPEPGEIYKAVIRDEAGKVSSHSFPVTYKEGYVLTLKDSTDGMLHIQVQSTFNNSSKPQPVYLFAHTKNIIAKTLFQFLQNGSAKFMIDKKILSDGISHFTVFDENLKPVVERLYFKQPERKLDIKVVPDDSSYLDRSRVRINLYTVAGLESSASDLSISVYRQDSLTQFDGSIVDYFWLNSDLTGDIESPSYYFSEPQNPEKISAIDNLMLVHGWRRFRWDNILNNKPVINFIPEYRSPLINGVVKKEDGSLAPGIAAYLSRPGKSIRVYCSRSDKNGNLVFEMQHFTGISHLIAQTNFKSDSLYHVEIVSPFSDQYSTRTLQDIQLKSEWKDQILQRSVAMQVQDIYYEEQLELLAQSDNDSTAFYGSADETYYLDDFTRFPVMEEVMREYVRGVWVRKRNDKFHFKVVDKVNNAVFEYTPLILLDGVPVFDEDEIMAFDPLKVKKLEVMTRRYYLGPKSFPGIVSYRTYTGDLAGFELNPKSITIDYDGLQRQREFFSPRYETAKQRESRMPDQRTLLFWSPRVITGNDGTQIAEFYTSDLPGKYRVVVEGITSEGLVGSGTSFIIVNSEDD